MDIGTMGNDSMHRLKLARQPVLSLIVATLFLVLPSIPAFGQTSLLPGTELNFQGYVMEMPVYENIHPTLAELTGVSPSGSPAYSLPAYDESSERKFLIYIEPVDVI